MPTSMQLLERAKRELAKLVTIVLGRKRRTTVSVLFIISAAVMLIWIIWKTVEAGNTGFDKKTLWDWMDLLLVPAALGLGIWWLNRSEKRTERMVTRERHSEEALQAYFDNMTKLLLEGRLTGVHSDPDDEEHNAAHLVARTRTISVFRNVGPLRKGQVLQFLWESNLIIKTSRFVKLEHADLQGANLAEVNLENAVLNEVDLRDANLEKAQFGGVLMRQADLRWANLIKIDLSYSDLRNTNGANVNLREAILSDAKMRDIYLVNADLRGTVLRGADLRGATLSKADLQNANLQGADLRRANLEGARVTTDQIQKAWKLDEAIMPDGSTYEVWQHRRATV